MVWLGGAFVASEEDVRPTGTTTPTTANVSGECLKCGTVCVRSDHPTEVAKKNGIDCSENNNSLQQTKIISKETDWILLESGLRKKSIS